MRPFSHADDAVCQCQRLFLVVRDHDRENTEPLLQCADFRAQLDPHFGVECRKRLVEQQQLGRHRHRARQRHALLLAAGQLPGIAVGQLRQLNEPEQFVDALL